jgi:hypothetical protein
MRTIDALTITQASRPTIGMTMTSRLIQATGLMDGPGSRGRRRGRWPSTTAGVSQVAGAGRDAHETLAGLGAAGPAQVADHGPAEAALDADLVSVQG